MTCLLLSETALRRLQPRLEPFSDRLVCVAMDRSGELGPRADLSPAEAPPQCGYLSGDLFADGLTDKFVNALLASAALDWVQSAGAGVDHAMFKALADRGVNIQAISTSEIKVSVLIEEDYTELAVRVLHTAYGLDAD